MMTSSLGHLVDIAVAAAVAVAVAVVQL